MKPTPTPLRYPGGKAWLAHYVEKFISFNKLEVDTLVEPFAGGAAVSITLLQKSIIEQAYISEIDPLIVAFWEATLNRTEELIEIVLSMSVDLETWHYMRGYLQEKSTTNLDVVELAAAFLFLNRTSYSGIIKAGPLGGKDQRSRYKINCRFNKPRIAKKIEAIGELKGRLNVIKSDGLELMEKMASSRFESIVFYVDPPYYGAGKDLYRHYFTDKEHIELSVFLESVDKPWLLSYDNADFIKELYKHKTKSPIYTDYQSGHFKKGVKELLISNYLIPPLAPEVTLSKWQSNVPGSTHSESRVESK